MPQFTFLPFARLRRISNDELDQRGQARIFTGFFLWEVVKMALLKRFLRDESGPTAVEYAVMLALIIVVCLAAISFVGTRASGVFSNVGNTIS